ncbi:MAG: hypothetical protein GX787_00700 [Tissierellia bacterium]|nr:hypothetical protein [Tissierellia bacterium]
MKENKVLLVSDFVGVGKVALSMMIPILNTMEANVSYLPTAVISNNFDYGKAVVEELTEFMKDTKDIWKELDFQFDIIATGILMNPEQVDDVNEIVEYHYKKPLIISDPIMGDHGELYPGLSKELVEASRLMALEADIIIPNLTEFSLIVGKDYPSPDKCEHDQLVAWLEKAKGRGVKSAIITSVQMGEEYYVYGYSQEEDIFRVKVDYVPVEVGGAGDIFTSLLIGRYVKEPNLKKSVEYATEILTSIIRKEYEAGITGKGNEIKIQNHLQEIYESL